MKVVIKTNISPAITVYDSNAAPSKIGSYVRDALNPYIVIMGDNDNVIYTYGSAQRNDIFPALLLLGFGLIGIMIAKRAHK